MITEQRYDWDYVCSSCGRGESPKLTLAQAAARRPERCAHGVCGGRMLLTRSDVGHLGSSIDPRVPTRLDTRPGHKAGRA